MQIDMVVFTYVGTFAADTPSKLSDVASGHWHISV